MSTAFLPHLEQQLSDPKVSAQLPPTSTRNPSLGPTPILNLKPYPLELAEDKLPHQKGDLGEAANSSLALLGPGGWGGQYCPGMGGP